MEVIGYQSESKTNGSNGFHVSFREGMFMVFVHLFWQNIPPQLATCSLGGYTTIEEMNYNLTYKSLQIYIYMKCLSFSKKKTHHSLAPYLSFFTPLWCFPSKHHSQNVGKGCFSGDDLVFCAHPGAIHFSYRCGGGVRWSRWKVFCLKSLPGGRKTETKSTGKCGYGGF